MDSKVKYGQEHGKNLIKIGKRLIENETLLQLLVNTDLDPTNKKKHPNLIDGRKLLNKNIRFVPLLTTEEQNTQSKIVLIINDGQINSYNSDNENITLLINVYTPFKEWLIAGDSLRPFSIMAEIRKTLQDRRINGLGEIKFSDFSLSALTEEMGCYVMRFEIVAFS